jgi:hypothetical protein
MIDMKSGTLQTTFFSVGNQEFFDRVVQLPGLSIFCSFHQVDHCAAAPPQKNRKKIYLHYPDFLQKQNGFLQCSFWADSAEPQKVFSQVTRKFTFLNMRHGRVVV